ncbi:hypothetical protein G6F40_013580 [Rhizopus arrhizus]|nr:hypothetical protein G6F40_013580 [Rhizopus arrhizus]
MRATAERAGGAGHIGVGRHHHHRQLRQCGLELVQQHQAVVTRHAHVGEQQGRRRPLAQRLQRRRGTVEINDLVARFAQRGAQHEAHGAVIVDHPDALCGSGEQQGEHGMARARAVGQRAAMLARHLLGQRQAQASAFGAATDQRQEQVFGQFLRHAPAVVGDLQAQRQRVQLLGDAHAMLHAGAQGDAAGAGLDRVAHQVPHRLGEAVGVAPASFSARRSTRSSAAWMFSSACGAAGAGDSSWSSRPLRRSISEPISSISSRSLASRWAARRASS